jgi:DNA invertase Pin-like site-specific DNA recombinase
MSAKNSTNGALRACAYYRKSTDEQEQSIDRQRDQVTRYAAGRGYRIVADFTDEGISGDEFDRRSGFQKMLAAAGRREFEAIVVDEPSRLSRQNVIELIEKVIAPLRRSGVRIDTASKGPLDYDSLAGIIMMTVHAHKSEDEARDLSRRVMGGQARRAKAGALFVGIVPYGLRVVRTIDPTTGKVIERKCVPGPEEEVRVVRFVFDAVANRGWSLHQVCRELEARRVPPPKGNGYGKNKAGGHWNRRTVHGMLTNRKYVGDLDWNKVHTGKYSVLKGGNIEQHGTVNRRTVRNRPEDVVIVPDAIPPLIDRETFARAAAVLSRAQRRTSPATGPARYLFTRLLICGDCGAFLRGKPCKGRKVYVCSKYAEYGCKACSRNSVYEDDVKAAAFGALRDDILSPERLDEIEAEVEERLKQERASGELDRLKSQAGTLARDVAQGNANLARLPADRLPGVVAQVRAWEEEQNAVTARIRELETGRGEMQALLKVAREELWRLREGLIGDDEEAQLAVAREVISKIEVLFAHHKTRGLRSPTGKGKPRSCATGLRVYVRPGLGVSCLFTSEKSITARRSASGSRRRRWPRPAASPAATRCRRSFTSS